MLDLFRRAKPQASPKPEEGKGNALLPKEKVLLDDIWGKGGYKVLRIVKNNKGRAIVISTTVIGIAVFHFVGCAPLPTGQLIP